MDTFLSPDRRRAESESASPRPSLPVASNQAPVPATVAVEQADGWLVVSKTMRARPAVPPYAYDYSYNHYDHLGDAHEHYSDLERGEYGNWQPVAIVPCKRGVPLGSKVIL